MVLTSPHINPNEHVWDITGNRFGKRDSQVQNIAVLETITPTGMGQIVKSGHIPFIHSYHIHS